MKKKLEPILLGLNKSIGTPIDFKKYRLESWYDKSIDQKEISYRDHKGDKQIRVEIWNVEDCYLWELLHIHGVKDDIKEGEQIVLTWP